MRDRCMIRPWNEKVSRGSPAWHQLDPAYRVQREGPRISGAGCSTAPLTAPSISPGEDRRGRHRGRWQSSGSCPPVRAAWVYGRRAGPHMGGSTQRPPSPARREAPFRFPNPSQRPRGKTSPSLTFCLDQSDRPGRSSRSLPGSWSSMQR
jgi:hypothetical protein